MDNKRKIALAVAAVAALGFGSLAWNNSSGQQAASTAEHGANDGHGDEKKAASAAKEEGDEGMVKKATAKRAVKKRAS